MLHVTPSNARRSIPALAALLGAAALAVPATAQCGPPSTGTPTTGRPVPTPSVGPPRPAAPPVSRPGPTTQPGSPTTPGRPAAPVTGATPHDQPPVCDPPGGPITGGGGGLVFDPLGELDVLAELGLSGLALGMRLGESDPNSWELWWDLNHRRFIDLDRRPHLNRPVTGTANFFLGEGSNSDAAAIGPADATWLRTRCAPLVADALETDLTPMLQRELLLVAGRVDARARTSERERFDEAIGRALESPILDVKRAACFAAGLTGRPVWAPRLAALVADSSTGRALLGGGAVPDAVRADAAFALAELATRCDRVDVHRFVVHSLDATLADPNTASPDVAVACCLAIAAVPQERVEVRDAGGRAEPASASSLAAVRRLLGLLESVDDARVRVHVPTALAQVTDRLPEDAFESVRADVGRALLARLEADRHERPAFAAAVAGCLGVLGRPLATEFDLEVESALAELLRDAREGTRHAAILALGRIAGAPGERDRVAMIGQRLQRTIDRGDRDESAWASLALGLAGHARLERRVGVPNEWVETLIEAVDGERDASRFTAAALGCALLRAPQARRPVLEGFDEVPEGAPRTRVALALGLLGVHDAIEPLAEWSEEHATDPGAAYGAALAHALLDGDSGPLAEELARSSDAASGSEAYALARALGEARTPEARERLLVWTIDTGRTVRVRAVAARALARAVRDEDETVSAELARLMCFEAAPASLLDGFGQGLLDRLDP